MCPLQAEEPVDTKLYSTARAEFDAGRFYDCGSPVCMFRLLKGFVRELKAPLVPWACYDTAIEIAADHVRGVVTRMRANLNYMLLLEGLCGRSELITELDIWFTRTANAIEPAMPSHLEKSCSKVGASRYTSSTFDQLLVLIDQSLDSVDVAMVMFPRSVPLPILLAFLFSMRYQTLLNSFLGYLAPIEMCLSILGSVLRNWISLHEKDVTTNVVVDRSCRWCLIVWQELLLHMS